MHIARTAIPRGAVLGLHYPPVRSPAPPISELLCFRRPLAIRLRLRAVVLALVHPVRQARCPMTAMRHRTVSRPRQGKCVVLAVCKLPRFCLGRTRVRYCVRKSKRRTLQSRRVPGRMRRSVDDRFQATQTRMCFSFLFSSPCMLYLLTGRLSARLESLKTQFRSFEHFYILCDFWVAENIYLFLR